MSGMEAGSLTLAQWLALLAWRVLALTVPTALALALWLRRRYVRAIALDTAPPDTDGDTMRASG